jgi:HEAT repeat protein
LQSAEADQPLIQQLVEKLKSDDESIVRLACLNALTSDCRKDPDIVNHVSEALHDRVDEVRKQALEDLCRLTGDHPECVRVLKTALEQDDRSVLSVALPNVARLPDRGLQYVPQLCELLNNGYPEIVHQVADILKEIGTPAAPEAVPALIAALHRQTDGVAQASIVRALGSMGPSAKAAIPDIEKLTQDTDKTHMPVQRAATTALETLKAQ